MSNQWEIDEWGSTSDLGWLPFGIEEVYTSLYFNTKDAACYFISKDTTNYYTSKGEA